MSSGEMSAGPRTVTTWQTFYWCVRRELFEHRSIYIAPAAAAGVALFGFLINTVHLPAQMRAAIADPAKMKGLSAPFEYVAAAIMSGCTISSSPGSTSGPLRRRRPGRPGSP